MQRIALGVSYDGSGYRGWQKQAHDDCTIQHVVESALSTFAAAPISCVCAGRTDAGVHANMQVIHIDSPVNRTMNSWVRGVNTYLPKEVAVRWAQPVSDDFHARFSALSRTYVYVLFVDQTRSPFWKHRAGWSFMPVEIQSMRDAAQFLLGEHDFSSFRAAECQAKSPIRELTQLDILQRGRCILFTLTANAFLHHMVRNIVGALVYVGWGKIPPSKMKDILHARTRTLAPPTFAPDGLYLTAVRYPAEFMLPSIDTTQEVLNAE